MALSQSQPSTHANSQNSYHSSQLPGLSPPQQISSRTFTKDSSPVERASAPSATDVVAASSSAAAVTRHSRNAPKQSFSHSPAKQSRSGLFSLAALARDKTTSVIANLSDPSIRNSRSSS